MWLMWTLPLFQFTPALAHMPPAQLLKYASCIVAPTRVVRVMPRLELADMQSEEICWSLVVVELGM